MGEYLPSMCPASGSVPSTAENDLFRDLQRPPLPPLGLPWSVLPPPHVPRAAMGASQDRPRGADQLQQQRPQLEPELHFPAWIQSPDWCLPFCPRLHLCSGLMSGKSSVPKVFGVGLLFPEDSKSVA